MQSGYSLKQVLAVASAGFLGVILFSGLAHAQQIDYETWKTLSRERRAELTANSRAMTYYLSGSIVADSDEENGNSYNRRKQGSVTINGELQKFDDGTFSTDRCEPSKDPNDLEPLLVEHSYEYNSSWGGDVKRLTIACSASARGTECKGGACIPVPPPPDNRTDVTKTGCSDWLFGCVCEKGYEPDYDYNTDKAFCSRTVEVTHAYNVTAGAWEEVITRINSQGTGYKRNPAWIYFDEGKDVFEKAAAAYRAPLEPARREKPERPTEESACVRDLVSNYAPLFQSCFKQVSPARPFDEYVACAEKSASAAYRKDVAACGAELLNPQNSGAAPAAVFDERPSAEEELIERFKKALVELRPKPEDFPSIDNGIEPGSDIERKVGIPYGPFISDAQSSHNFSYIFTLTEGGATARIALPDGTTLDPSAVWAGARTTLPAGSKIITPPGGRLEFKFFVEQTYKPDSKDFARYGARPLRNGSFAQIVMDENSELDIGELYEGFAVLKVKRGYVRFYSGGKTPLQAASETGVAPITKGTDFAIAYDLETRMTIVELYDGAVDLIRMEDYQSENPDILASLQTTYDGEIPRAEVSADGAARTFVAIPRSEWDAFVASSSAGSEQPIRTSKSSGRLNAFILLALIAGFGFWLYEKKLKKIQ